MDLLFFRISHLSRQWTSLQAKSRWHWALSLFNASWELHLLMQCTLSTSAKSYFNRWDYLNLSGGRQPFCDFTLYRLSDIAPYSATGPPFQCLGLQDSQFPGLARSRSVPRRGSNPEPLGFSPRALPLHHFNSHSA